MPRGGLGGDQAASLMTALPVAQKRERKKDTSRIQGSRQQGGPVAFPSFPRRSLLLPRPLEDRAECVCAVLELTRAARVTWPGHVQPAPFLPQQLAHKQPGCCGGGGGDMCERGGGARGPARAKGRTGLLGGGAASTPADTGLPSHRKFLVLPRCSKTCFGGSDFQ